MNKELRPFLERAKKCYDIRVLERLGLTPDMEQRDMILTYFSLIFKWNSVSNLVSKKDENNVFLRHFCDSIQPLLLFGFKKNAVVVDIGPGGGFPSIPIRIFRPDISFTLVDSNRKKCSFLRKVISELDLKNVTVRNERIENMDASEKKYDYVLNRGVGSLEKMADIAKPFIDKDGRIYTFKTDKFEKEIAEITMNKDKNGVCICEIAEYDLDNRIYGLNLVSMARI